MIGQPVDYWGQLSNIDLGKTLTDSFQGAQQQQILQAQQQRAAQQQAQLDQARQEAINNPSAAAFNKLFALDPKSHEAIKAQASSWSEDERNTNLREVTAIDGLLAAGQSDAASARVQRRIDADKAAGLDTADDEDMLAAIKADPKSARLYTGALLTGILGDKAPDAIKAVGDDRRADAALPGELAKTAAETDLATAQTGKTAAEAQQVAPSAQADQAYKAAAAQRLADQTGIEAQRLDLDKDTLATNTQLELDKLHGKGTSISPTSEQTMNGAVVTSEASRQLGARASALADKLDSSPQALGGVFAQLNEAGKGAFGKQDAVSALRKEYQQLANSQAVMNLPPGPASDKDIKLAMAGFPPPSANAPTMASFLRGMAKLQTIKANRDQAKADWISENGNLGRAKNDITVNGVKVPAGTNFGEFSTSASSTERRAAPPERSYYRFSK